MTTNNINIIAVMPGLELLNFNIENTLHNFKRFLNGSIEIISLPNNIDLYIQGQSIEPATKQNFLIFNSDKTLKQIVLGNAFFASHDEEGKQVGLSEEQLEMILDWFHNGTFIKIK